jgi:hypothetical protein
VVLAAPAPSTGQSPDGAPASASKSTAKRSRRPSTSRQSATFRGRKARQSAEREVALWRRGIHAVQEDQLQMEIELQVRRRARHHDHGSACRSRRWGGCAHEHHFRPARSRLLTHRLAINQRTYAVWADALDRWASFCRACAIVLEQGDDEKRIKFIYNVPSGGAGSRRDGAARKEHHPKQLRGVTREITDMRKIVASEFINVDGMMSDPGDKMECGSRCCSGSHR